LLKAVQFGAGNIGRGFIGQLLFEGGYHTTFIDANDELVRLLNERHGYPLRLVDVDSREDFSIGNVTAISASDTEAVTEALANADLISTAVGVAAMSKVAEAIAGGIAARADIGAPPADILLCENQWHSSMGMRATLLPLTRGKARDYLDDHLGLVETVIGRMVPAPSEATRAEDPLLVVAEPYKELPIAREMLRAPVPALPGLIAAENFEAYEARKLYLHNMGHAGLAYLGYRRGYEFIWQCVGDEEIQAVCEQALLEARNAISLGYGMAPGPLALFCDALMRRFANQALGDSVARVAADPLRKLRWHDRLIGAAKLCEKMGMAPTAICKIIAAALQFDSSYDLSAVQLQASRSLCGDSQVLETICGVTTGTSLHASILAALNSA
jgi:mannitol-1-phosphate 5-dehydrogenase